MPTKEPLPDNFSKIKNDLCWKLSRQREAYLAHPMPLADERIVKLNALKKALLQNQNSLCCALNKDYGHRSNYDSLLGDIMPCIIAIKHNIHRIHQWMRPQLRKSGLLLTPANVKVMYQPQGIVGIVVPWNFPVWLSIGPLISALSAGNRAMIKMSEFSQATNLIVKAMLAEVFSEDEVVVVEGELDVATAFVSLPFDHLIFTGSTQVGRSVMRAAADNLTPVTLELGGKSPALIAPDFHIKDAVKRLIYGKCINAGQSCVAPDYVLLPRDKLDSFVEAYQNLFDVLYPDGVESQDYTSIINKHQYDRLIHCLDDARNKGARIIPCGDKVRNDERYRLTTHLVLDASSEMTLMQEEIFGPLLPVIPYDKIEDAMGFIQKKPRPLAMYLFTFNNVLKKQVLSEIHSGGVCINDTSLHAIASDAPFGGIGPSGMGRYHGHEGFLTFSNVKTVVRRGHFNASRFMYPPYGQWLQKLLIKLLLR